MVQELEIFKAKIDVDLGEEKTISAFDKLENKMWSMMSETKGFQRDFTTVGEAMSLAFEMPERKSASFFSLIKQGFAQMRKGGTDAVDGFDVVNYGLAQMTAKVPGLRGVSDAFAGLSSASVLLSAGIDKVRLMFSGLEGDEKRVMQMLNETSMALKTQGSMWTATQKLAITETRALVSELKKEVSQQEAIIRSSEKTMTDPEAGGMAIAMATERHRIAQEQLVESTAKLTDAQAKLAMQTSVQSPLLQRVTSNISTMDTAMKHIFETYQTQQIIPDRWVEEANRSVKAIRTEMGRLQKTGVEVPPDIQESFYRMVELLGWAQSKSGELAEKTAKSQKVASDEVKKASVNTKDASQSINIYNQSVTEQNTKTTQVNRAINKYSTELTAAEQANKRLVQYVQPSGMMNTGLERMSTNVTKSSQAASTFSLSLGSTISVAGALGGILGELNPAFSTLIVGAGKLADQFMRSFTAMISVAGTAAERIKAAVNVASASLTAFGVMAAGAIVTTGQLGMKVTTLEISLRQIAANLATEAGGNVEQFQQYVMNLRDTIVKTGITTREATDAMLQFTRAKLPLEEVEALAEDAKNLAVTVGDMSSSEVYGRLIEVITTGNSQLLKDINIVKTADQMYTEYAKTIDKTSAKELTIAERRQAIIEGLHKETASIAGVYEAAMGTAGKQLSSMKRLFEESMLSLGRRFEPMLAQIIKGMSDVLKWFTNLDPAILDGIANAIKFVATWGTAIGVIMSLIPLLKAIPSLLKVIGAASPQILAIGAAIGAIVLAVKLLRSAWDQNFGGIQGAVTTFMGVLKTQVAPIVADIKFWFSEMGAVLSDIVSILTDMLFPAFATASSAITAFKNRLSLIFFEIKDVVNGVLITITGLLIGLRKLLEGDFVGASVAFKNAIINALTSVALIFKNTIGKAAAWGWNLIVQFSNGITKAVTSVLAKVMNFVGRAIGRFIKPGSPPEEGPLHYITAWGQGVMAAYMRGFETADFSTLKDVLAPIQQAFQQAVSLGKMDELDVIPATERVREQLSGLLVDFRKTGTINEGIMTGIATSLGEGNKELTEYIRRVLNYQKALKNLADVQKEYAAAEKSGFVRKELKDRLTAAEEQAKSTEDAMNWQKEYLAAMQETVDAQTQQLALLERMAEAMEDVAGALGAEGKLGKEGELEPEELPFELPDMSEMGEGLADLGDTAEETFGQVSQEFLDMKAKIEGWIESIKTWLALPLGEKLQTIRDWFTEASKSVVEWVEGITGIDFSELGAKIGTALSNAITYLEKLTGWDISQWVEDIKTWLGDTWDWIVEKAQWLYDTLVGESIIPDLLNKIMELLNNFPAVKFIKELVQSISDQIDLIKKWFAKVEEFLSPLTELLSGPFEAIKEIWESLVTSVSDQWPVIQEALAELGKALADAYEQFKPFIEPVLAFFGQVMKWLGIGILTTFLTILGTVFSAITGVLQGLASAIPGVVKVITGVVQIVVGLIRTIVLPIINLVTAAIKLFTGDTEGAMNSAALAYDNFLQGLTTIWEGIKNVFSGAFSAILLGLGTFVLSFIGNLVGFGAGVLEKFGIVKAGTADSIKAMFTDGIDQLKDFVANFETWWSGLGTWLTTTGVEKLTAFWENWKLFWGNLGLTITTWLTNTSTSITEWTDSLVIKWTEFWTGLGLTVTTWLADTAKALTDWIAGVILAFAQFYLDIVTWFANTGEEIGTTWQGIWDNLLLACTTFATDFSNWIIELKDNIVKLVSGWTSVGESMINNIKEGITNGWEAFKEWFKSKLGDLAAALPFSEPKDPTSPLRGLGKAGQAIFKNIFAGMDQVDVAGAFRSQLAGMSAQLQTAAAVSNSTSYNVNFNGAFPNVRTGKDATDVGRQFQGYMDTASVRSRSKG